MKLKALIKRLEGKTEHLADEVEFIIVRKSDGAIVTMEMEGQAPAVVRALRLFKGVER